MKPYNKASENKKPHPLKAAFGEYVMNAQFPCIMAQSVFQLDQVELKGYNGFGSPASVPRLLDDLTHYLEHYDFDNSAFFTFIAAFPIHKKYTEKEFEYLLWKQLQYLHEADEQAWDPSVSYHPEDDLFSFSLAGKAFYVVGLHPGSSRKARQSPCPALVFNLHFQFEKLREMGVYTQVRDKIRERDIKLQGNINPMVQDFGKKSEARQYSGRAVDEQWKCPFHHKNKK